MLTEEPVYAVDIGRLLKLELGVGRAAGGGRAIELVSVRDGSMRIVAAGEERGVTCPAAVIPPHASFSIRDVNAPLARLFVEPDSDHGRRLMLELSRAPMRGSPSWAKLGRQLIDRAAWVDFDRTRYAAGSDKMLARAEVRVRRAEDWHPAIRQLIEQLELRVADSPTLPMLVGRIGVDVERIRTLFGRDVGMSVGTFVDWFRLQRFAASVAGGDAWKAAAAKAGFKFDRRLVAIVNRSFGFTEQDLAGVWIPFDGPNRVKQALDSERARSSEKRAPENVESPPRTKTSRRWIAGYPNLVAEWHPDKNGALLPEEVSYGSNVYVWWRCPRSPDHEWRARANARVRGDDCPFCASRRVSITNSLATRAPAVAAQWHPTRNGERTPADVVWSGTAVVWWLCPLGIDHEWEARVNHRTSLSSGCPFCANLRVSVTNSLAAVSPALASEWHSKRNRLLPPDGIVAYSTRLVWWQCHVAADHVWRETPNARLSQGRGCPFCSGKRVAKSNSLAMRAPSVAAEWHPTKNGEIRPTDVTSGSHHLAWWRCRVDPHHVWRAMILNRTRDHVRQGSGCPVCAGRIG